MTRSEQLVVESQGKKVDNHRSHGDLHSIVTNTDKKEHGRFVRVEVVGVGRTGQQDRDEKGAKERKREGRLT